MSINDGRVVSNFAVQALKGEDITLYGDGLQTRSFCYVTDLIEGIFKMAMTESVIDKPINLGNPRKITMIELAQLIIQITNSNSKLIFKPLPEDDPKQREPDINSARKILNWEPSVSLEEGVAKTVSYFETLLGNT
jgi:UDP-glucuronate decarboxylase